MGVLKRVDWYILQFKLATTVYGLEPIEKVIFYSTLALLVFMFAYSFLTFINLVIYSN